jgi:hypothetical protein
MSYSEVKLQDYSDTINELKTAISGLNAKELSWKEKSGVWSITEVLSHLLDHNIITSFRIREILSESNATLPVFNQDRWVVGTKANESSANEVLESFGALLHLNLNLFRRLPEDDWNKKGVNSKGETVHLFDIINLFIKHVHHHIKQIVRIKEAIKNK